MVLEPLNGFTTSAANFADRPNSAMSAAEVKAQFDAAPEELRVFVNGLITQLNTDFALKSEIATALLGQILDGSLTDAKLSNVAGQIKERLSSFIATKGNPNGLASLGIDSKIPSSQLGLSIKTGTISHGGTIPKTTGYTNYYYMVSAYLNQFSNNNQGSADTISHYCYVNQETRVVTIYSNSSISGDTYGIVNYIEIAW